MTTQAEFDSHSRYVAMRDGVRLAVQVFGPPGFQAAGGPTVVNFTRYGRATPAAVRAAPASETLEFTRHGFAVVSVDVRGTGASFGCRPRGKGREEVRDYAEIFDWIVAQPWSDGRLFCTGVSYGGNASELAQINRHPALVAVAPRFTDFDLYEHLLFPGGVPNHVFAKVWGELTAALDRGDNDDPDLPAAVRQAPQSQSNAFVDGDDGALYRAALADHDGNAGFLELMDGVVCRDDLTPPGGASTNLCDLVAELEAGAVPAFHWASWMDAGTAAGAIARFLTVDAPMQIKIGAWNHGARQDGDPYTPRDAPLRPDLPAQVAEIAAFFKAADRSAEPRKSIAYVTLGSDTWRTTDVWPPRHVADRAWRLAPGVLAPEPAPETAATNRLRADLQSGSGATTRWSTQVGREVDYADRAEADRRLLTYTSAPLERDLEVTGTPILTLHAAFSAEDAMVVAYLEDVAPDGRVTYLTEGELRLMHRRVADTPAGYVRPGPNRSFLRKDAAPYTPGVVEPLTFPLLPTSVVFRAGHRIRLALGCADADSFPRLPATGDLEVTVDCGLSRLVLPSAG